MMEGSAPSSPPILVTDYTSCQLAAVSLNMTRPPQTCPGNYTANLGGAAPIADPEPAKPHARIKPALSKWRQVVHSELREACHR